MSDSLDALPPRQRKPPRISTDIPLFVRCSSDSLSTSSSPSSQNTTPGTIPSTGIPQYFFDVMCMHDFESSDPVHLPFHKDEVLTIIKQEHSGWWAAMRPQGDRIGWIPSSFVLPLDRSKIVEHLDETLALWPYEGLNDPFFAVHDPWVPVSEDYTVLSFRLVTPTDLVLYKGSVDNGTRNHNYESFPNLSYDERSTDMGYEYVCVPLASESPPPHKKQSSHLPSILLSEPGPSRLTRPTSPPLLDATLHHHPHSYETDDQTSPLCLTTPVNSDETTPELVSSFDIGNSLAVLKSVAHSDDGIDGRSQSFEFPADFRPVRHGQSVADIKLVDPKTWEPDGLAEQLCVLMHTLYATIRQDDCLDWTMGRRRTNVTGLRRFFDIHDYIASWVQKSTLACDDMTRQTETLDFWIKVAEKCQALRNFDSLCAIILALSGSSLSSLGSAWSRCAHKQTFATLRNMLDVANKFHRLVGIMNMAKGPSVPFVRRYLEHIKELPVECSPRHAGAGSLSPEHRIQLPAISTLLRHQSSPYDFKITMSIRSFIGDELQVVRLANGRPLASNWDIQHQEQPE